MMREVLAFIMSGSDLPMLQPSFHVGWYSLSRAATLSRLTAREKHLPCRALCTVIPLGSMVEKTRSVAAMPQNTACRPPPHRLPRANDLPRKTLFARVRFCLCFTRRASEHEAVGHGYVFLVHVNNLMVRIEPPSSFNSKHGSD
jgi:hypothetical protein